MRGFSKEDRIQLRSKVCKRNRDMWVQIDKIKDEMGRKLEVLHVRGHQDDEMPYKGPGVEEQRNVDCDKAAKERVNRIMGGKDCLSEMPPSVEVMFWTDSGGLTCDPYWWIMEQLARKVVKKKTENGRTGLPAG